jgi:hypothetical protein
VEQVEMQEVIFQMGLMVVILEELVEVEVVVELVEMGVVLVVLVEIV